MRYVRMISPDRATTEWNHTLHGIFHPTDDGSYLIPEEAVGEAMKASLELAPLSQDDLLQRVSDAISRLDDGPMRTALFAAITTTQLTTTWQRAQS
jgi:hypothetical protein